MFNFMGISTSNKYRRPSALSPLPPPPWAPVNHSPVLLRAPQPAPASPQAAAPAGRASWEPRRPGSRLAITAERTWGVRVEQAVANFPPLKKQNKKNPKPLNSPGVAPGERRLQSGSPSYRDFGAERAAGRRCVPRRAPPCPRGSAAEA